MIRKGRSGCIKRFMAIALCICITGGIVDYGVLEGIGFADGGLFGSEIISGGIIGKGLSNIGLSAEDVFGEEGDAYIDSGEEIYTYTMNDHLFQYMVNNNEETLTIVGYTYYGDIPADEEIAAEDYSFVIEIPDEINGKTVTNIGYGAFKDVNYCTDFFMSENLVNIEPYAFKGCTALKNIRIPAKTENIDINAFYGCNGVESITVNTENKIYDSRNDCNGIVEKSTNRLILGCMNTVIPNNIEVIGDNAFYGCDGLKTVAIPESVVTIESYAFEGCSGITELYIPAGTVNLCWNAFSGCSGLESIVVSEDNKVYDSRDNCNGIVKTATNSLVLGCRNTVIKDTVLVIDNGAFHNNTSLEEIAIHDKVYAIGSYAFYGCSSLKSISMSDEVSYIGYGAFVGCSSLTDVRLSENLGSLTDFMFYECKSLKNINIPKNIVSVGNFAFTECESLESVELPNTLTTIGEKAFDGCDSLKSITVPESVEKITSYAMGYYWDNETGSRKRYSDFVIYGYTGSSAKTYARNNNINFISIGVTEDIECFAMYKSLIQSKGWEEYYVCENTVSGSMGEALRMEGFKVKLIDCDGDEFPEEAGTVKYMSYVQRNGWESEWVEEDNLSGTEGKSLRVEAVKLMLEGDIAENYDIYYRVYVQKFGWLGWAKNGEAAGTKDYAYRIEGLQINIVKKGEELLSDDSTESEIEDSGLDAFYDKADIPEITYTTHVRTEGWLDYVSEGRTSGTMGKALRIEAVRIIIDKAVEKSTGDKLVGGITYITHVQSKGWISWVKDGEISGTVGKALRVEAIAIKLTGDYAEEYDVYYRTYVQKLGWLGWAKNGEMAGTSEYGYRMEALEIRLTPKDTYDVGSRENYYLVKE